MTVIVKHFIERRPVHFQLLRFNRSARARTNFPVSFANDKAKRLLDWSPKVDFVHGAELTRAWLSAKGYLA